MIHTFSDDIVLDKILITSVSLQEALHDEPGTLKAVFRADESEELVFISKSMSLRLGLHFDECQNCIVSSFSRLFHLPIGDHTRLSTNKSSTSFSEMIYEARQNKPSDSVFVVTQQDGSTSTMRAHVCPVANAWQIITHILLVLEDPPQAAYRPKRKPVARWTLATSAAAAARSLIAATASAVTPPPPLPSPLTREPMHEAFAIAKLGNATTETKTTDGENTQAECFRRTESAPPASSEEALPRGTSPTTPYRSASPTTLAAVSDPRKIQPRRLSGQPGPALRLHRALRAQEAQADHAGATTPSQGSPPRAADSESAASQPPPSPPSMLPPVAPGGSSPLVARRGRSPQGVEWAVGLASVRVARMPSPPNHPLGHRGPADGAGPVGPGGELPGRGGRMLRRACGGRLRGARTTTPAAAAVAAAEVWAQAAGAPCYLCAGAAPHGCRPSAARRR